jgi:hypothetical protein
MLLRVARAVDADVSQSPTRDPKDKQKKMRLRSAAPNWNQIDEALMSHESWSHSQTKSRQLRNCDESEATYLSRHHIDLACCDSRKSVEPNTLSKLPGKFYSLAEAQVEDPGTRDEQEHIRR